MSNKIDSEIVYALERILAITSNKNNELDKPSYFFKRIESYAEDALHFILKGEKNNE